jgi:AraC-like DNA-binding protein
MDNPDPLASETLLWLDLSRLRRMAVFEAQLWGDRASERSSELTPLYAQRFLGPRASRVLSAHPFWELTAVFRGKGRMISSPGAPSIELRPNVVVLIPPGVPHCEESAAPMETVWIGLQGRRLQALSARVMQAAMAEEFIPICEQLWLRGRLRQPLAGPELDGLAQVLLAKLLRLIASETPAGQMQSVDMAIRHLHQNYAANLTVARLAERAGCSEGHLHRAFRTRTGLTPMQYLARLRIETALHLMREGSLPLGRIARLVGFSDPLYFSRVFRKCTGRAPSDVVREIRAGSDVEPHKSDI